MFRILFLATEILLFLGIILFIWGKLKVWLFNTKAESIMNDADLVIRNRKLNKDVEQILEEENVTKTK